MMAQGQLVPEMLIGRGLALVRLDEHAVVPAHDFGEGVAHGLQEQIIGREDVAVQIELDDGLHLGNGLQLAAGIVFLLLLLGDVGGVLDDFARLALAVEDRVVAGLQPHIFALAVDAAVASAVMQACCQALPELGVLGRASGFLIDKHAVVLADDLFGAIAHGAQKVVIGRQHMALQIELDHGLHLIECSQLALHVGALMTLTQALPERALQKSRHNLLLWPVAQGSG